MMNQDDQDMESLLLDDLRPPQPVTIPDPHPLQFNSFLDPPSYAEAIFTSFDNNNNSSSSSSNPQSPDFSTQPGSESDYLLISVTDPLKQQELPTSLVPGGNTYYTYLITTRTNLPGFGGPGSEFTVRRRFRDVVTLSDRLSETYRGYFIPVRPDKSTVESQVMQKNEFVEQRRVALEKYLRKLGMHPVIRKSEELRLFLEVRGKLPLVKTTDVASGMLDGAVKLPRQLFGGDAVAVAAGAEFSDVAQPAKGGRDLLRIFKELKQSVANDWGGTKPLVMEEDKEFMERKEKLVEFEQQLSTVSQQV